MGFFNKLKTMFQTDKHENKITTEEQKQNKYLVANIKRGMEIWSVDKEQLAQRTNISLATLYNRFNNPSDFHLSELRRIAQSLHTTVEDLMKAV